MPGLTCPRRIYKDIRTTGNAREEDELARGASTLDDDLYLPEGCADLVGEIVKTLIILTTISMLLRVASEEVNSSRLRLARVRASRPSAEK